MSSSGPAWNPRNGRNTLIAMGTLAAGFAGFWYSMKRRDQMRRERGSLEAYEYAYTPQHPGPLPVSDGRVPPPPTKEHNAQHITVNEALAMTNRPTNYIPQPAPQRDRGDGSGLVYTKKVP
ncbi:hypothetical protein K435DRAFT_811412 [Dendrothele bispora CBS 962.96]|uniref:Uncharacterized protein n=1 Tax=Dendrothele bispora (strain CBS 962.96) TaxID=1314807 RepID=A0A4V6T4X7_DENBC|nr:hypothetical protein K435DRAFT_811412 [Dendrothele bispora CBS 962.96]